MKAVKITVVLLLVAAGLLGAFYAGRYAQEQEQQLERNRRCQTLIKFALDKAQNKDLADPAVVQALISNLYGAHEFCDDPGIAARLNSLWNELIFDETQFVGQQEALVRQLQELWQAMKELELQRK